MKIARVGEVGNERVVVVLPDSTLRILPESLGDVDAGFWSDGRAHEIRTFLATDAEVNVVPPGARRGAPIAKPEKIICIGLNYRDHVNETGATMPTEPVIFMKAPNCVIGPDDEILVPRGSTKTDWEIELGVVIGKRARYLPSPEGALSYVGGYCISHDVSEREFQLERGGQWDKGKSCETFNPLGPWLVTPDEIDDPQNLGLRLSVNGVRRQDGSTHDMIFDVAYLIWYVSQFMVLEPGDLINTGTPAGVSLGHDDVPFLKAGDVVELSIDGLGSQRSVLARA
jgi:2-keto-4-pentenoate hydratase/2-oxohepta-3-ene-1,7-dioic acid hydratase in catechol pathway